MNHGHAFKKCQAIDFSQTILSVINYTSITALSQSTTNEFDAFIPFLLQVRDFVKQIRNP